MLIYRFTSYLQAVFAASSITKTASVALLRLWFCSIRGVKSNLNLSVKPGTSASSKSLIIILLLFSFSLADAAPKMRPYSGIGVLRLSMLGPIEPVPLYDDPGIGRCCKLQIQIVRDLNNWLFGVDQGIFLLVTARKGEWLEIERDDAGRTGWVRQERRWNYQPWEQFLKGKMVVFLRNSPKKMIQVFSGVGSTTGKPVSITQPMRIIQARGDWAYILLNQNSAGWIRWRDSDGRLLIGFNLPESK